MSPAFEQYLPHLFSINPQLRIIRHLSQATKMGPETTVIREKQMKCLEETKTLMSKMTYLVRKRLSPISMENKEEIL